MGGIEIGESLIDSMSVDDAFEYAREMVVAELNGADGEVESTEDGYRMFKNDRLFVSYIIVDDAEMEFDFLIGN